MAVFFIQIFFYIRIASKPAQPKIMKKIFTISILTMLGIFNLNAQTYVEKCVPVNLSTPVHSCECPIEVCIIQNVECEGSEPFSFNTCSEIKPNSGDKLCFKEFGEYNPNCKITVNSITLKRIATGETVTVTGTSAQTLFNIFNGLGGAIDIPFDFDCDGKYIFNVIHFKYHDGMIIMVPDELQ